MKPLLYSILLLLFISTSCIPTSRLTYLQDNDDVPENLDSLYFQNIQKAPYQVQVSDILNISIRSLNPDVSRFFNSTNPDNQGNIAAGDILFYLNGYSVNIEGKIEVPVLGDIYVLGKNLSEIKQIIELRLQDYFKEESIFVGIQLAGVRFTVIGDVKSPGKFIVYQNQVSIFEALAQAGDIELVGDRRKVQIIRQKPKGIQFYELDLTDKSVVTNPEYFIKPNDIINVKPLRAKSYGIGTTGFATIVSLVTLLSSTLLIIVNLQNLN